MDIFYKNATLGMSLKLSILRGVVSGGGISYYDSLMTILLKMPQVPTIQARVTRNPLQTGMQVRPQPRSSIPLMASQAKVCGKMQEKYLKLKKVFGHQGASNKNDCSGPLRSWFCKCCPKNENRISKNVKEATTPYGKRPSIQYFHTHFLAFLDHSDCAFHFRGINSFWPF